MVTRVRSIADALNMAKGWLERGLKVEITPMDDSWYEVRSQ